MQLHTAVGEIVITPASILGAVVAYFIAVHMGATPHTRLLATMGGYTLANLAVGLPINLAGLDLVSAVLLRPLSVGAGLGTIEILHLLSRWFTPHS